MPKLTFGSERKKIAQIYEIIIKMVPKAGLSWITVTI